MTLEQLLKISAQQVSLALMVNEINYLYALEQAQQAAQQAKEAEASKAPTGFYL